MPRDEKASRESGKFAIGKLVNYGMIQLKTLLNLDTPMRSEDRLVLEESIIPHYLENQEIHKVLFVGCDWYTKHYRKYFADREYWTMDLNPARRRYASSNHVVDSIENIGRHFSPGYFDWILCNGVFGWGLNSREGCDRAFGQCYETLREGGLFLFGWNNVPEYCPIHPDSIESLQRFARHRFPPLDTWRYHTASESRHVYDFYVKAGPGQ